MEFSMMRAEQNIMTVLWGLMVMASSGHSARIVSGQTVCQGGAEHPCYKMAYFRDITSRVAFWEARKACEMDGGSLLSIENAAEQRHIEHLLQELRTSSTAGTETGTGAGTGNGGIADGDFWIGLTRTDGENTQEQDHFASCPDLYHWTDGSVSQFRKWYFDEPSCGGEACVVMYHQPTALHGLGGAYMYQWNDDRCNMKHNFICKYEPESHLVKEQGDRPGARDPDVTVAQTIEVKQAGPSEEDGASHVVIAGPGETSGGMFLVYVIIPTIPLLLLILVASGTCCFQMFSKSKPGTKTSVNQSTLWISKTPKTDSMEV
ncbi:chondrolectin-like isoform X1 [Oncorhynchus tshawytscha]|uniref:C-type lectin domain-containing protein n=1 Tax=Oncorhynchus tshawytscha TaxID=74940 RepID=A0AAZ3NQT9_ONCTS|nr:chondrolectin-like isoform X1 [Oncorhynchus tshawytscha]